VTKERVQFARERIDGLWMEKVVAGIASPLAIENAARLDELLRLAALNPDTNSFDLLVILAANQIRESGALPDWLAHFAADVLSGKVKRPRKKAEDFEKTRRDFVFWRVSLEVAERYQLPLYTNNELSDKTTAAEIVGQASGCTVDVVVQAIKKSQRKFGGRMAGDVLPQDGRG